MTRRDLEILIDCVEDAQRTKKAACRGHRRPYRGRQDAHRETQVRAYCIARLGVQSTMMENEMETAIEAEEAGTDHERLPPRLKSPGLVNPRMDSHVTPWGGRHGARATTPTTLRPSRAKAGSDGKGPVARSVRGSV